MSDKYSYLRLASKIPGDDVTFAPLADRLHFIVTDAANPLRAGDTVMAQIIRAQANLGAPKMWRVKSAWWRDGSHAWSAQAAVDFEHRYQALLDRRRKQADHERAKAELIEGTRPDATLDQARAELRTLRARIDAIETALCVRG
jgi:hypothetical protein